MGNACSDAKKRPRCIPPISRFETSTEEVSESSCSISFYSVENQNRSLHRYTPAARLEYTDCTKKIKTTYIDRNIVTSTNRGRTHKTITISELKIRRRSASEHISFHNKGDSVGRIPDFSDHETNTNVQQNLGHIVLGRARRTLDKSVEGLSCDLRDLAKYESGKFDFGNQDECTISTEKTSNADISLTSDRVSKSTRWERCNSETSVSSRSSKSPFQKLAAKKYNSDKPELMLNLGDCTFRVVNEQKERSPISDDTIYESEHTSLKTSQRNSKLSIEG